MFVDGFLLGFYLLLLLFNVLGGSAHIEILVLLIGRKNKLAALGLNLEATLAFPHPVQINKMPRTTTAA